MTGPRRTFLSSLRSLRSLCRLRARIVAAGAARVRAQSPPAQRPRGQPWHRCAPCALALEADARALAASQGAAACSHCAARACRPRHPASPPCRQAARPPAPSREARTRRNPFPLKLDFVVGQMTPTASCDEHRQQVREAAAVHARRDRGGHAGRRAPPASRERRPAVWTATAEAQGRRAVGRQTPVGRPDARREASRTTTASVRQGRARSQRCSRSAAASAAPTGAAATRISGVPAVPQHRCVRARSHRSAAAQLLCWRQRVAATASAA